jgi:hypothetical protein
MINPVTCISRDVLLTTTLGGGGKSKQPVVIAGDGVLLKNLVPLVPAEKLLKISPANTDGIRFGTFITGLVATPIQNLSNFSSGLRRFQVDRAGLGTNGFEISALAKTGVNVKARVRLTVTVARLALSDPPGDGNLKVPHAFSCFTNNVADVTLTLPAANLKNVGLEYYFAVNPDFDDPTPGSLTIRCKARDSIQIRKAQTFNAITKSVIETTKVVEASQIKGTLNTGAATPTTSKDKTVVLSCKAPRLWVAESVAAIPDNTAPLDPDWTITPA